MSEKSDVQARKHSKKHRREDSRDRREDNRDKKHRSKKHHRSDRDAHRRRDPSKRSRKDMIDSQTHRKHSHAEKKKLWPLGKISNTKVSETQQLDADRDYFTYHNHLRLFLYRNRGTYFEDLSSSEARNAFEEFCQDYNDGKLEMAYYDSENGLPVEALDECKRTRHIWTFRTSETEKKTLVAVKDGVRKQTEYDKDRT